MITFENNWKENKFRHIEFRLSKLTDVFEIITWLFVNAIPGNRLFNAWISVRYYGTYCVKFTVEYEENL